MIQQCVMMNVLMHLQVVLCVLCMLCAPQDIPHVHLDSSALSLTNATFTFRNTTVHMYASALALTNSQVIEGGLTPHTPHPTASYTAGPTSCNKLNLTHTPQTYVQLCMHVHAFPPDPGV